MPRNGYTPFIRKREQQQLERQQKQYAELERELHGATTTQAVAEPYVDPDKEHRRARREQNRRHKPKRSTDNTDQK